jgi:hypothetical protein
MSGDVPTEPGARRDRRGWLIYLVILGLYLTLRGYHSFDGDQTYRLPLLLHHQDSTVFADDPFVRAFDAFNPHRGSVLVLDLLTRPLGLSIGLFLIFVMTFGATCLGVDRLARAVWPDAGFEVGPVAVGLLLAAKAGNVGTNHLFEAMVLDRLMAFALGWLALAEAVVHPGRVQWRSMAAIALATLIHPSVGLQLALVLAASWVFWSLWSRWTEVRPAVATRRIAGLVCAVIPGVLVNLAPGSSLEGNMPADVFWLLSVELQSPQHMLPHLWRMPQWLGWCGYLMLAALTLAGQRRSQGTARELSSVGIGPSSPVPAARLRLASVLAVILVGLAMAWYAIEVRHQVRATVFQPFRMATVVRGIALIFVAGRLVALWRFGGWGGRLRTIVIAAAFTGDWLLVVVTLAEVAVSAVELIGTRLPWEERRRFVDPLIFVAVLVPGLNFLGHHDTEYGNRTLVAALGCGALVGMIGYLRKHVDVARHLRERKRFFRLASNAGPSPLPSPRRGEGDDRSLLTWSWESPAFVPPLPGGERVPEGRVRGVRQRFGTFGINLPMTPVLTLAWLVPLAALLAAALPLDHPAARHPLVRGLINRCRFAAVPADDVERLGLWCREHTPATARLIGPPGPKTLRLWSRRSVAFNRAASPYHGAGLADWFARFQDHVHFHGSPAEFVRAYVRDRHGLEARYQAQSAADQAALALRQGATYVVAAAPGGRDQDIQTRSSTGPLELLHVEGLYAVYRVNPDLLVQRQR